MADINNEQKQLIVSQKGFLDVDIDVNLDLFAEIDKLKKELIDKEDDRYFIPDRTFELWVEGL